MAAPLGRFARLGLWLSGLSLVVLVTLLCDALFFRYGVAGFSVPLCAPLALTVSGLAARTFFAGRA